MNKYKYTMIKNDDNDENSVMEDNYETNSSKQLNCTGSCAKSIFLYIILIFAFALILFLSIKGIMYLSQTERGRRYIDRCKKDNYCVSKFPDFYIDNEKVKEYDEFKVSFDSVLRRPYYTIYKLETTSVRCKTKFFADPELNTFDESVISSGKYDKGHLVPAIDISDSCETFTMANVAPQVACYNRGIWNTIEKYIRSNYIGMYVLTAAEYNVNAYDVINDVKLYVPIGFYKVVMNKEKIVWSIYLRHDTGLCYNKFTDVGDFDKLPDFIQLI